MFEGILQLWAWSQPKSYCWSITVTLCANFNPIKSLWTAAYTHISMVSTAFIVDLTPTALCSQYSFPLGHVQWFYQPFPTMSSWNGNLNPMICAWIQTWCMWYGHPSQNRSPCSGCKYVYVNVCVCVCVEIYIYIYVHIFALKASDGNPWKWPCGSGYLSPCLQRLFPNFWGVSDHSSTVVPNQSARNVNPQFIHIYLPSLWPCLRCWTCKRKTVDFIWFHTKINM